MPATLRAAILSAVIAAVPSAPRAEGAIRVTSSDGALVSVDADVASVLIADPTIADVQVLSGRTLFLFGKVPGATRLFVLDAADDVMLERRVVVTAALSQMDRTFSERAF